MKLLITDLECRKSFDIVNICESKGYKIIGLYSGGFFEKLCLPLIYLEKLYFWNKMDNMNSILIDLINQYDKVVYLPIEEDSTTLMYTLIQTNKMNTFYYNLPPQEAFDIVKDKGRFSTFCINNNILVPKEYNHDQLVKNQEIPSNLIIKPKRGSGSIGIKFINTYEELLAVKKINYNEYIIQERLANSQDIEGAFFLFDQGRFVSYYGHERIRSYPPEGGVTIYSKVKLNDTIKAAGIELLEKLNWSGIAMIEFLYDHESNEYKIIEVNPRVWGSIMLSEFCGANLIDDYIKTALGEDIVESKIKEECYIRWLFPWDFLLYFKGKQKIKGFWNFETEKTCYINFSYASWYRSIFYTIYNIFDIKNINKFYNKVFKK